MSSNHQSGSQTLTEAQRLIAQIEADIAAGAAVISSANLDPAKMLPPAQQQELERLIAADQAAIEQEVAEGAARLRAAAPAGSSAPRRAHKLI